MSGRHGYGKEKDKALLTPIPVNYHD